MQMLFKCIIISFLSLLTVQVLNAAETGGKSIREDDTFETSNIDDKGQKCFTDTGKLCQFPFKNWDKVTMAMQSAVIVDSNQSIFRFMHLAQMMVMTNSVNRNGAAQKVSTLILLSKSIYCLMS